MDTIEYYVLAQILENQKQIMRFLGCATLETGQKLLDCIKETEKWQKSLLPLESINPPPIVLITNV